MPYTFKLLVGKEKTKLALFNESKETDSIEWTEGRDMGKRLLQAIEELLKKNHLQPEDVSDFAVTSEVSENYTSVRIAETVQKTYMFSAASLTRQINNLAGINK